MIWVFQYGFTLLIAHLGVCYKLECLYWQVLIATLQVYLNFYEVTPKLADNSSSLSDTHKSNAAELIPLQNFPPAKTTSPMSSPRTSRAWDITTPGPSMYKHPRRSSSSVRRPRNESLSSSTSFLPYDPDVYNEDIIPQDVIFDGPSASSVPTSITNFAHRGSRSSFADEERAPRFFAADFDSDAEEVLTEIDPEEEDRHSILSSRASEASSVAVLSTPDVERGDQFPLIRRKSSDQRSEDGEIGKGRATQKIYLTDEDMVVVMSGFKTRKARLWIYRALCVVTLGLVYLLLRWLPRWRLKFLAQPMPLSEAHWLVVEVDSPMSKLTF